MKATENYGSEYLYAEDLLYKQEYRTVEVTISEVIPPNTLKTKRGRAIDKWSVRFEGKEKTLVLCKTNVSLAHHIIGDPPGATWVGKVLTLQARIVDAFGTQCTAIRVMPPKGCLVRKSLIERLGQKAEWKAT